MKKIICLAVCSLAFLFGAQAQTQSFGDFSGVATPFTLTASALTDAANDTVAAKIAGYRNSVTFQVDFDKLTGTTSSVVAKLFASSSGTINYNATPLLSVTMPDADTSFSHTVTGNPHTDYVWILDGGGTQTSSTKFWLNIR